MNLESILLIVHVLLSITLIGLILIQHGKGADAGAAFGAGASGTVFGAAGATSFIVKLTTWVAIAFFATSLGLAYMASKTEVSKGLDFDTKEQTSEKTQVNQPEVLAEDTELKDNVDPQLSE